MSNKLTAAFAVFVSSALLHAAPVQLENSSFKLTVFPEKGGKITSLQNGNIKFDLAPNRIQEAFSGLGKERILGDSGEYMEQAWKIVSQSPRSLTLRISGVYPPRRNLEITKTYTLPEQGNYVKVELKFKNANPIEGGFRIVPWLHQSFVPDLSGRPENNVFYLSHKNGVEQLRLNPKLVVQSSIKNTGNWVAYLNADQKRGLLMVSEQRPEVIYDYVTEKICSLEFLYNAIDPTQETGITYYLAPISALNAAAVKQTGIPLPLNPAPSLAHVSGEKTEIAAHFRNSTEENIPVNFKFWKSAAYVSPDVVLPLTFGIRNIAVGKLMLEVDLPEFVKLEGNSGNYWWHTNEDMKLIDSRPVEVQGRKYNRHRFEVTSRALPQWFPSHCRLLVRAQKNSGNSPLYYRGYHNGKQVMESSVPCEVIRIAKAEQPKDFKVLMGIDYGLMQAYPGFENTMKYLGINGVCLNYNVPNSVVRADDVKKRNAELKKSGFMTSVMGIYFAPRGFFSGIGKDRDLKAVDVDGKPLDVFDFTARGPWMDNAAQGAAKHMKLGYDLIISDYEAFFGAERYSFTPRTREMFKQYFTANYPKLNFVDAVEIGKSPDKYPEHHKIWIQFKCDQFADYVKTVVEKARKLAPDGAAVGWCTIPGGSDESIRMDNLIDNGRFSSFLDYNMPMLYDNLYRTMPSYSSAIDLFRKMSEGRRAVVFPTLTLGFWGEGNPYPPEHSYFLLLETALTQCKGAYIFPGFAGADNLGVMYLSRALDKIAKIEHLIKDAKRLDRQVTVKACRNTELNLPALVKPLVLVNKNKMLVWLAEYSKYPVTLSADFNLPVDCRVAGITGPAKNGTLKKGAIYTVTLAPGDDKGQLLLLETADGSDFPASLKEEAVRKENVDETGMIFYDPFDGSTKGKNGSKDHFWQFDAAGHKGQCLFLRDYESFWILPRKFDVKSEDVTIDFCFQPPRMFGPKGGMLWDLIRGDLSRGQNFWLFFDPASGKLCFASGKKGKGWDIRELSKTDRWAAGIWLHVKLNFGKSGVCVTVNGEKEIDVQKPVWFNALENLQIGRPYVSVGRFDELRIFDGRK